MTERAICEFAGAGIRKRDIAAGTVGSTAITYSGTVSGNSMPGSYQVHTVNGPTGSPWSASKS